MKKQILFAFAGIALFIGIAATSNPAPQLATEATQLLVKNYAQTIAAKPAGGSLDAVDSTNLATIKTNLTYSGFPAGRYLSDIKDYTSSTYNALIAPFGIKSKFNSHTVASYRTGTKTTDADAANIEFGNLRRDALNAYGNFYIISDKSDIKCYDSAGVIKFIPIINVVLSDN